MRSVLKSGVEGEEVEDGMVVSGGRCLGVVLFGAPGKRGGAALSIKS